MVAESQRTRLIDAMSLLVNEVGYADVTIGAVTSRARTAKRTFYTHFRDRDDCFAAAYDRAIEGGFRSIGDAVLGYSEPYDRLRAGLAGLLGYLAEHPPAAKLWLEVSTAGSLGMQRRMRTLDQFAGLYMALHRAVPSDEPPPLIPMTRQRALSVVGAIELPVDVTLHERGAEALPELLDDLTTSVFTLVYGRPPAAAG